MEFDPTLVHEWLHRTAVRLPEKTSIVCGNARWTYRMLDEASNRLAAHLLRSGMKRGDRVAILLENSIQAVVCMYAAMKAGGAFVALDKAMQPSKLIRILGELGAHTLVTHADRASFLLDVLPLLQKPPSVLWVGVSEARPAGAAGASATWEEALTTPWESDMPRCLDVDLACLIYTSGSTGQPKGIMSTHHNVIAACRSIIQYLGNDERDVILCTLPLSFDYGLYQILMCFMFGGTIILEQGFVYTHPVLERIRTEGVTGFPIVPSILAIMLRLDDLAGYGLASLRYVTNTGAALPEANVRRFRALFPHVAFYSMFGLTECKRVSYLPPEEIDRLLPSVGKAMPNCEVLLVDEQGREVPQGTVGEMIVRGSNVMQGYWQDPEGSRKVFGSGAHPSDRWLHTGDYFHSDPEGNLFFTGRRDDMIKCRGERVSPREIESALLRVEGISEAAVRGVPDEIEGQAVAAFVVASPESGLTEQEVRGYCSRYLESSRVPRYIRFVDQIPRNVMGKIDWKRLHLDDQIEMPT